MPEVISEKRDNNMVTPSFGSSTQEAFDRPLLAYRMRECKKSLTEIGQQLGVSATRAGQLVAKGKRLSTINVWWDNRLPWMIGVQLNEMGISSKQALAVALESKRFYFTPRGKEKTKGGLGKLALTLVCQWIGVDPSKLVIDPIGPREFSAALRAGKNFNDAIVEHLTGNAGVQLKLAVRIIKGVAALDTKDQKALLEWAASEPNEF